MSYPKQPKNESEVFTALKNLRKLQDSYMARIRTLDKLHGSVATGRDTPAKQRRFLLQRLDLLIAENKALKGRS